MINETLGVYQACKCGIIGHVNVKAPIGYHIEEIPFRTANKLEHVKCMACHGVVSMGKVAMNSLSADMIVNKAFLAAQDREFSVNEAHPIDIFCSDCGVLNSGHNGVSDVCSNCGSNLPDMWDSSKTVKVPVQNKTWIKCAVKYSFYDENNFLKYGTQHITIHGDVVTAAAQAFMQFQRPDSFKSINGAKVWGPDHTLDNGGTRAILA